MNINSLSDDFTTLHQEENLYRESVNHHSNDSMTNTMIINPRSNHQSAVLEELSSQIEELQAKLKTSYRKLILFETENQKLIQEKNAFFFDNKILTEHNSTLVEQNKKITAYNQELEEETDKQSHKIEIAEKLIATQKIDLGRLSKFHLKVKNIIKPFVENLKSQNLTFQNEIVQKNNLLTLADDYKNQLIEKIEILENTLSKNQNEAKAEKSALIDGYEEQIHFLSKEIVEQQQVVLDVQNENLKLKKQCENKLFVENELIKHKRSQDEHIQTINSLTLKVAELQRQLDKAEQTQSDQSTVAANLQSQFENTNLVLDATRKHLSSKITEIEEMHMRLKMLEKLNTNLSLNLKDHQI